MTVGWFFSGMRKAQPQVTIAGPEKCIRRGRIPIG